MIKIFSIIFLLFNDFVLLSQHVEQAVIGKIEKNEFDRASIEINPRRIQLFGITTEPVIMRSLEKTIRTVGIVDVDERSIFNIQTKFSGWIEELFVNFVGMKVKRDQPLFRVYSQELFAAQEEYLLALKDFEHPIEGKFADEFMKASKDLLKSARDRLLLWDISKEQIARLEKDRIVEKSLTIRSPCDGIVLQKNGFVGMNVGPGITTYTIADLSNVWVLADLYEDMIPFLLVGQEATLTIPSTSASLKGKVTFIDYVVGTSTRTAKARFEFKNSEYKLKPGMYATVEIKVPMGSVLSLPEESLIDTGERKIVFVFQKEGLFVPREIDVGFKAGKYYQIISGMHEGEQVVTSSQFLIDSESRLRALEQKDMQKHGSAHN